MFSQLSFRWTVPLILIFLYTHILPAGFIATCWRIFNFIMEHFSTLFYLIDHIQIGIFYAFLTFSSIRHSGARRSVFFMTMFFFTFSCFDIEHFDVFCRSKLSRMTLKLWCSVVQRSFDVQSVNRFYIIMVLVSVSAQITIIMVFTTIVIKATLLHASLWQLCHHESL
jgi:hypothetical protein